MKQLLLALCWACVCALPTAQAQTTAPPPASPEQHYYDFWPGAWARVVNGRVEKDITFRVKRGLHAAAFEEEWRQVDDKGVVLVSRALRAWDQLTNRWMFAWVSDNALFQVWEGRKYGDHWYIVREFAAGGRRFWSRQAWLPTAPDRVTRVMERSFDEGKTWELRSRMDYERVPEK